ncbi:MAG: cyclic nucleotide-binding domain-containing protein [Gammaproteobacteria bacterium]|nr:cyclic nucleotide-binding domain-containing protein [Gammaproteobacteria bacterium]
MRLSRLRLLQSMPIFGGVEEQALDLILDQAETIQVDHGHYFFKEEELASSMYVLEQGRVEILRAWEGALYQLNTLNPGDCFGEMALMGFRPRSASVRALERCSAIEITTDRFAELYETFPQQFTMIQMNMGREVCRRLCEADTRLFVEEISKGRSVDLPQSSYG